MARGSCGRVRSLRRAGAALLLGLAAFLGEAAAQGAPPPLRVVATIAPFHDWARRVGGDRVEARLLLPAGASPHTFEPTPGEAKEIVRAALLLQNGLGLEAWAAKLLRGAGGPRVVTLTEGLPRLRAQEEIDPEGGARKDAGGGTETWDPHMWLDPVRARGMVERIAGAFSAADPAGRDAYARRAAAYLRELEALDAEFRAALAPHRGRPVVTYHGAFGYLLDRYDLRLAAVIEPFPGKEPTPKYLQAVVQTLRRLGQRVVFAEPQLSAKPAQVIAREVGGRVAILDPLGGPGAPGRETYLDLMRWNLKRMKEAFGE